MVRCVAGGVNHPESESRRLEALAERRGGGRRPGAPGDAAVQLGMGVRDGEARHANRVRSEEHTSELQSPCNLVCRLLLEKKKKKKKRCTKKTIDEDRHAETIDV